MSNGQEVIRDVQGKFVSPEPVDAYTGPTCKNCSKPIRRTLLSDIRIPDTTLVDLPAYVHASGYFACGLPEEVLGTMAEFHFNQELDALHP